MRSLTRVLFLSVFFFQTFSGAIEVNEIFQRLTGKPLLKSDPRFAQIEKLLSEAKMLEAARVATDDPAFYDNSVRHLATALSNRAETPLAPLNDFVTLFVGGVRDELDARTLLTGNFRYEGKASMGLTPVSPMNNKHYEEFDEKGLSLQKDLIKMEGQWGNFTGASGLLTTRAWAEAHLLAGTNRRSTEFAFREFLCAPIESWKTPGLSKFHIRRDVDRKPGGDSNRFENECRTCHAALDGMTGAFSGFDFKDGRFIFASSWIAPKYNQNSDVFPDGYPTQDASWVNLLATPAHIDGFGWRTSLEGYGVREFGVLISESKAFSRCMVKRVFERTCRRQLQQDELTFLTESSDTFEKNRYNLKLLFERMVVSQECLKGGVR